MFHSSLQSHRVTRSATSYVYNHIGGLAASHESLCKSLFLSGVTHRFPTLRFGFLEGGVAWACSLFADLVGHWEKRNARRRSARSIPICLDVDALLALFDQYGDDRVRAGLGELRAYFSRPSGAARAARRVRGRGARLGRRPPRPLRPELLLRVRGRRPARRVGVRRARQPAGARLRPIFGSDISHWDVPDMTEPVEEAYELVEDGVIGEREFRELMFLNPARLHAEMNPGFFDGTVCEHAVRAELSRTVTRAQPYISEPGVVSSSPVSSHVFRPERIIGQPP